MSNAQMKTKENITFVIKDSSGNIKRTIKGKNIVTTDGDTAYAQMIVGEASAFDSPYMRLGTGTTVVTKADTDVETFISGSGKALDTGFPQRNNADPGNTDGGVNVITWKFSYALGDINTTGISEGAITNDIASPTGALNHFLFAAAFDVASTDQLTVYVNHTMTGV